MAALAIAEFGLLIWATRKWLAIMCAILVAVVGVPQSDLTTFISYPTDALLTLTLAITAIKFYKPAQQEA